MGDDENGHLPPDRGDDALERRPGDSVEVGVGFVEEQQARPAEHRPGKRDALALAGRQALAALTYSRPKTLGQPLKERLQPAKLDDPLELLGGGLGPAVAKVALDAPPQKREVRARDADGVPDRAERAVSQILTVDAHDARVGVLETGGEQK